MRRTLITVFGHVQGVGFRYAAQRKAAALGLAGWVRNRTDGAVEIAAEGTPEAVEELIAWARHGPSGAAVEHVTVQAQAPQDEPGPFRITS